MSPSSHLVQVKRDEVTCNMSREVDVATNQMRELVF